MSEAAPVNRGGLAGSRLGSYDILRFVGAGGMGDVYKARDRRLGRDVALKVLPGDLTRDADRNERFEREARAASALSHPNIVTVYEIGRSGDAGYVAMEYVEGKTLRDVGRAGPLSLKKLLDVALQIARGLARAHAAGIVHRDLKPENVIVSSDGNVKILDFGLAKLVRSPVEPGLGAESRTLTVTRPGTLVGTFGYMSPEQVSGDAVDFRSDQFSFGAVLYEMATGRRAFHRDRSIDTLAAVLHEEPAPVGEVNPGVPMAVRWMIGRCLSKDPSERYASTDDLARELAWVRDHLGESEEPRTAATRRRRGLSRTAALGAAAALVAMGAGFFAFRRFHPSVAPRFVQLTFRRGGIWSARFAPDGESIVYGASWEGMPLGLFLTRIGSSESRSLELGRADVLSVSRSGDMAVLLGQSFGLLLRPPHVDLTVRDPRLLYGTLAEVPLAGGAPREILDRVLWADWGPPGRGIAVVHDAGKTQRLEYPIGHVLYENEPWINRPRVSPDGRTVAFQDPDRITILTPPGAMRSLDKVADELAWSPSGREIWYSRFDGVVTRFAAVSMSGRDRTIATLPGDFVLHDIDSKGRVLVSSCSETSEIRALVRGESNPRNLSWLDRSDVVAVSEDGQSVLFEELGPSGGSYLRPLDGGPAKRLGSIHACDLSPDGKWVIVEVGESRSGNGKWLFPHEDQSALNSSIIPDSNSDQAGQCALLPTGAGEIRRLPPPHRACGTFFAGGTKISGMFNEKGQRRRLWIRSLDGSENRPFTPEGTFRGRISPDGAHATALGGDGHYRVYSGDGKSATDLLGLQPGEEPIQWSRDGRTVFVRGADEEAKPDRPLARVYRVDPWSGRRELFWEIPPLDPSAGGGVGTIRISANERVLVYTHYRFPSELFLIEGLE